jgi:glyoxylase-like metal-dependent hydrolase (beta-lactamase superfamily II)
MIESITSKLLPLPAATAVLPGHGDDTTIGDASREYAVFASKQHAADLCGDVTWEGS